MVETASASSLAAVNADMIEAARKAGQKITTVIAGPPPDGYVDLFVYQPNPPPGPKPEGADLGAREAWQKTVDYYKKNYFELPPSFQPISGISGLIIAARRACAGGKKLRQLRIMGHGSESHMRIGLDQVWLSKLIDANGQKTAMARELESLKAWLDPRVSLVILDHCLCGQAQTFLTTLSDLWGGVAVRGYIDNQTWEHSKVQVGEGTYRECRGGTCHEGVEHYEVEEQAAAP